MVAEAPVRPAETVGYTGTEGGVLAPPGGPVVPAPTTIATTPVTRVAVDATARVERRALTRLLFHLILLAGALTTFFPFYWMVVTAFKTNNEAIAQPPTFIPREWHPENFGISWSAAPFPRYFMSMQFVGKNVVFAALLATMMIPSDATLIPNFVIVTKWLGWYNTYQAQFVPAIGSVFAIFLLRQFFLSIPKELEEAALIDGCSRFRFLWAILLPLSVPALITVALMNFLAAWNSFLWPLLVTSSPEMRPIQLGLIVFQSEAGGRYAELMAASSLVILPTVLVFLLAQKYFVEGIARTGLKG